LFLQRDYSWPQQEVHPRFLGCGIARDPSPRW
jgi:hypothetical protein